jgi:hypothetical protein
MNSVILQLVADATYGEIEKSGAKGYNQRERYTPGKFHPPNQNQARRADPAPPTDATRRAASADRTPKPKVVLNNFPGPVDTTPTIKITPEMVQKVKAPPPPLPQPISRSQALKALLSGNKKKVALGLLGLGGVSGGTAAVAKDTLNKRDIARRLLEEQEAQRLAEELSAAGDGGVVGRLRSLLGM